MVKKRFDGWLIVSVLLLVLFIAVLIYPMFGVIKQAVIMPDGSFSWEQFHKFFPFVNAQSISGGIVGRCVQYDDQPVLFFQKLP